jgi:hypothetical protein
MTNSKYSPQAPFHLYSDDQNTVSRDSELFDQFAREHIDIGGVVVYAYRYVGTPLQSRDILNGDTDPELIRPTNISEFLNIQDPVLGENRDRIYDFDDIPRLRGAFKVSQNDMIYGKFGPQGLNNDVYSIEFHTRTIEKELGRRFIIGDVLEFPHLKDVSVSGRVATKLYEVARVMKAPTGWDQHYVNHVLGLILKPVRDQQEFLEFMERRDQYDISFADQASTYNNLIELNKKQEEMAREVAPSGIFNTDQLYFNPKNKEKRPDFWTDDGKPPDGITAQSGKEFPIYPKEYDYFIRTDFYPNRMFQFYHGHWHIKEIDKHLTWREYAYIEKLQTFLTPPPETD